MRDGILASIESTPRLPTAKVDIALEMAWITEGVAVAVKYKIVQLGIIVSC